MSSAGWGLVGALFLAACSGGEPVDIGNEEVTGEELADYVASWDGYAEAYEFADGSDRVRITLDANGEGTLTLGDSPAPDVSDLTVWWEV